MAADVHETAADAEWSVTLVADNTNISEGESATLTAFASSPVDGSGVDIMIFGISPSYAFPHQVADCVSGSSCSATVLWEPQAVEYVAYIGPSGNFNQVEQTSFAASNAVTIPSSGAGGGDGGARSRGACRCR